MMRRTLQYLALAPAFALGAVLEQIAGPPTGWADVVSNTSVGGDVHAFTIALAMLNIGDLESRLLAVSTPGSPSYGKYLTKDEVDAAFAPSPTTVSIVTDWLKQNKVQNLSVSGAFIDFTADIKTANQVFNASYKYYSKDNVTKLRTTSYSIPDHIADHVSLIDPGVFFGSVQASWPASRRSSGTAPVADVAGGRDTQGTPSSSSVDAACQIALAPSCLKQMYNVGNYVPDAKSGSRIGFASYLSEAAQYVDQQMFEDWFNITRQGFDVEVIAGGINHQNTSGPGGYKESDLDAQCIIGMAHPLPMIQYITGGSPPFIPNIDQPTAADNNNEPYVPYYRQLLSKSNSDLPQVISTSYGDQEDTVPYGYATLVCNLIGFMGLRGITVLESSGDTGVGSGCLAPDYKTVEFNAQFPATCPYVTAVGGTVKVTPEVAWNGSSGGFSKYFSRPSYQKATLDTYMGTVSPETKAYYAPFTNWAGRGFPDLAAHSGDPWYQVIYAGQPDENGGTSAATPLFAGIVGLLNDARLRKGMPALGFLNPLIYTYGPKIFTDITDGFGAGCNGINTQSGGPEPPGSGLVPGARWNATAGWDPVTGYGTPDFQKMKELVLSL